MRVKDERWAQRMHRLSESRDVWKQRVVEKQRLVRYLRVKIRDLEASRARWKNRAMAATAKCSAHSVEPERAMTGTTAGE